jgi:hypothetical protein
MKFQRQTYSTAIPDLDTLDISALMPTSDSDNNANETATAAHDQHAPTCVKTPSDEDQKGWYAWRLHFYGYWYHQDE